MKHIKNRKKALKRLHRQELMKREHSDIYQHYVGIGYQPTRAVKLMQQKVPSRSIMILENRYNLNANKPGISGFTLEGIKKTPEVQRFIDEHHLTEHAGTLYYPRKAELFRY